jgi:hypothetical protein
MALKDILVQILDRLYVVANLYINMTIIPHEKDWIK